MNSDKSILVYTNDTAALETLTRFTEQHNYKLRLADDIVDVIACPCSAAVIQRDLLQEPLFSFLKEVYIDEIPPELLYMEEELQWEFEETLIVFGDGPEIVEAFKYFFIELPSINEQVLSDIINKSINKVIVG
jgi:hypothetical protein